MPNQTASLSSPVDPDPPGCSPLVPAEVNVAVYPWAPVRLEFLSTHPLAYHQSAEPFRALILLVANAWRQRPAMSLPCDDSRLAAMAGFGRDIKAWSSIREEVLKDWVLASDSRWHHPEFSGWALQAWAFKLKGEAFSQKQRERASKGALGRAARGAQAGATRDAELPMVLPTLSHGAAAAKPKRKRKQKEDSNLNINTTENTKEEGDERPAPTLSGSLGAGDFDEVVMVKEVGQQDSHGGDPVDAVFRYWRERTSRPHERMTVSRRRTIEARIEDGLPVETMCRAIDGAASDDFYQGRTAKQPMRIDTLDVICKDRDRVLRLASLTDSRHTGAAAGLSNAAEATARSFRELLEDIARPDADPPHSPPINRLTGVAS